MFGQRRRHDADARSKAESLVFLAKEIDGAVDAQLATADALDVKIGGLFAVVIAIPLALLGALATYVPRVDDVAAIALGLVVGYGVGAAVEGIAGLRAETYWRWPDPAQYANLAAGGVHYQLADLARDAAAGKAATHARNRPALAWKSTRLGWVLAFVSGEAAASLFALAYTVRL